MTSEEKDVIVEMVKDCFNKFKPQLPPMLFVVKEDKNEAFILDFPNEKAKNAFTQWLSKNVLDGTFKRFALVTESYSTSCSDKENLEKLMEIDPEDRPNTKEVIFILFSSPTEEYSLSADITIDYKGNRQLGEFVKQEPTHTSGRFTNMFKKALSIKN